MLLCLIFLVTSSSVEGSGDKHISTQHTAVLVGHNITLKCGEDKQDNASWMYESIAGAAEQSPTVLLLFATQDENDGRFLLKNQTGRYDLFISSAKQSHAGVYTCTTRTQNVNAATTTMTIRIELAVIIDGPNCDAKRSAASPPEDYDYITMECDLKFRGNVAPVMKWRNKVSKQGIASQTDDEFNRHVRSTVTLRTDQINDEDGISCTIFFNQSSHFDIDSIASAPKFEYVWTSSPIAATGKLSSFSSSSDLSESMRNTSPLGAKTEDESLYWSPLLISLIALTALLAIVILISFVVRRRGRALKEQSGADRIYYEDPTEVVETREAQVTSGLVRIFYENPNEENVNSAFQPANEDLDNIYSEDPVVILTNDDNQQSPEARIAPESTSQSRGKRTRRAHEYMDMDLIRDSRETALIGDSPLYADTIISSSAAAAASQQLPRNGGQDSSDRIIYAKMTSPGRRGNDVIAWPKSRQRNQPMFSKSVYAAIDHTLN